MKIFINLKTFAITKIETESPFYQGEENENCIRVLFDEFPNHLVPAITYLLPNGMKIGPVFPIEIEKGQTREIIENGNLSYYFDFILSTKQDILALPGLLQMALTLYDLDGKDFEKKSSVNFANMIASKSFKVRVNKEEYKEEKENKENSYSSSIFSNQHVDINLTVNNRQTRLNFVEGQALLNAPEDGCISLHAGVIELIPSGSNNILTLSNYEAKLNNSNIINESFLLEKLKNYISLDETTFIGVDKNLKVNFVDYRYIDSVGYPIKTYLDWNYKNFKVVSYSNIMDSDVIQAEARMEIIPGKAQLIGTTEDSMSIVNATQSSAEMYCYANDREARLVVTPAAVDITISGQVGEVASVSSHIYIAPNKIEVTREPNDKLSDYSIVLPENNKLLGTKDFTLSDEELDEIFMGAWE